MKPVAVVTGLLSVLCLLLGVNGTFKRGELTSVGVTCALCHSTVDDSLAPGIGQRLDGWAAGDLNVGAVIAASPNPQSLVDRLSFALPGVTEATVVEVLNSWGGQESSMPAC